MFIVANQQRPIAAAKGAGWGEVCMAVHLARFVHAQQAVAAEEHIAIHPRGALAVALGFGILGELGFGECLSEGFIRTGEWSCGQRGSGEKLATVHDGPSRPRRGWLGNEIGRSFRSVAVAPGAGVA